MKRLFISLLASGWLVGLVQADNSFNNIKDKVSLPPSVVSFIAAKEQQAEAIAATNGFKLPADFASYFAAAKAGRAQAAQQIYSGLCKDTNSPAYKTPLKQAALDTELVLEAFASSDATLVQSLGEDFMNSLPPGCIYFGGSDPGRGLPTFLCDAPGDPVFVLSQNAFLDGRYMKYIREMYGSKIKLPTPDEMKEFTAPVDFNSTGWFGAYTAACGQIIKSIMAKNPTREFYYEQSYAIAELSSNVSPHGLVLKLNPQPVDSISTNDIQASDDFWAAKIAALKSNPAFASDHYVRKSYAFERATVASLYADRAKADDDTLERSQFCQEAERAFQQALDLNASLPEAVQNYVVFKTMVLGQPKEALPIVQKALEADPSNSQFKALLDYLQRVIGTTPSPTPNSAQTSG